jgi:hypothetical protein
MNFNSEIFVNEKALSSMKDVAIEFAHSCVMECSRRYKFDGDEAVRLLGLRNPTVKTKMKKEKRVVDKPKFIFPYSGGRNEDTCQGLILNGGLFTQCEMSKKTQLYCGKCSKQAEQNSHGTPNYGTIMDRNSVGIMEYIDPTGKGPLPYLKFIKKKKWDLEQVQEEARKYSIEINEIHFVEENSTKKRGRKPRVRSQVAYDTDDEPSEEGIFDTIIDKTTNDLAEDNSAESVSLDDDDDISSQFLKMGVNEVAQQEPEPVLQITEPPVEPMAEQEMPVDVMVLEEEIPPTVIEEPVEAESKPVKVKNTEKKTDKTEKQKQKEIEKQAKLLEKEMEKKKKEEEATARKALAAAAKISKPSNSKQGSNSTDNKPKADVFCKKGKEPCIVVSPPQVTPQTPPTPKKKAAEPSVSVKPFTHNGVRYYKSSDNILYDKSGNPQGLWDETTKTINQITEEDVEEEEESEEDDNSEEEEEEYEEEEEEQKGSARHASKPNSDLLDEIEYYECLGSN